MDEFKGPTGPNEALARPVAPNDPGVGAKGSEGLQRNPRAIARFASRFTDVEQNIMAIAFVLLLAFTIFMAVR